MTPHEIIRSLREMGARPMLPAGNRVRVVWPAESRHGAQSLALLLEMYRQHDDCAAVIRAESAPWRPGVCVVTAELMEIVAWAWPDADPESLGLVADPIAVAVAVADFEAMASMGAA